MWRRSWWLMLSIIVYMGVVAQPAPPRNAHPAAPAIRVRSELASSVGRSASSRCAASYPSTAPRRGFFSAVAAVSTRDIWAVGGVGDQDWGATKGQPLVEHWDGVRWTVVPSPNPGGGALTGVAVVSSRDVWAVGNSRGQPLIEHWDGVRWTIVPNPRSPGAPLPLGVVGYTLNRVAAISTRDVWAAGTEKGGQGALIEHWDGVRWRVVASPQTEENFLASVATVSGRDVWVVGGDVGGIDETMTQHWNGARWRLVDRPANGPTHAGSLTAITALSTRDVWAVGGYDDGNLDRGGTGPLAQHWDGARWQAVVVPVDAGVLSGVTGASTRDVWAVGAGIAHWDGTSWRDVRSPAIDGLSAVAALSSHDAWAVGVSRGLPAAEYWDGRRWSIVPAAPTGSLPTGQSLATLPSPFDADTGSWEGIAAISTSNIWVVGQTYQPDGSAHAVAQHWDGSCWRTVRIPDGLNTTAIAVGARTDVWSLGASGHDVNGGAPVGRWDGTRWHILPAPVVNGGVSAVAVVSADDVWAVGNHNSPGPALTVHWDGRRWRETPSPNGPASRQLSGVAAVSSRDVWAVGGTDTNGGGNDDSLAQHWDGVRWRAIPTPHDGALYESILDAVAAVSAHDVWAVGRYGFSTSHPLIDHWDGRRWAVVPSPRAGTNGAELTALAVVSRRDIWAVGDVVEHWDGAHWLLTPLPNVPITLDGVAAVSHADVWAVGNVLDGNSTAHQVILHWDGMRWSIVP